MEREIIIENNDLLFLFNGHAIMLGSKTMERRIKSDVIPSQSSDLLKITTERVGLEVQSLSFI